MFRRISAAVKRSFKNEPPMQAQFYKGVCVGIIIAFVIQLL